MQTQDNATPKTDDSMTADEARALDLLLGFDKKQLEIMLFILDLAFGHE